MAEPALNPDRDDLGGGAARARMFGRRLGMFTLAEAANLVGLVHSTVYYWHANGVFSPTGNLGARSKSPAQRCYSSRDVLFLACLREARTRGTRAKRGRLAACQRRLVSALRAEKNRNLTSFDPAVRTFVAVTDEEALVFNGLVSMVRLLELLDGNPKSMVVIDIARVNAELPEAVRSSDAA